jgi:AAA+ superfamily predicted ATPase
MYLTILMQNLNYKETLMSTNNKDKLVLDLGALYVSLCYTYAILDSNKKTIKKAYTYMKELYLKEAEVEFAEDILEVLPEAEITSEMLFHCYDSVEDAINLNKLFSDDRKSYMLITALVAIVREAAQDKMDAELLQETIKDGVDMDIKEASNILQVFLNGPWIKTLMVNRPGMMKTTTQSNPETYGVYDKRKNTAKSFLEDDKSFAYMNRTHSVSAWFARELSNYSDHLKGTAGGGSSNEPVEWACIADLLSGVAQSGDAATERDWAEGTAVTVTFTGVNLPGVALRIEPIQFTVNETKYLASQIEALNELANRAEGICVTPESLLFGKNIEVKLTTTHAKFTNSKEFKDYDLSLVNIDRPAQDLVEQIKGVLSKPEDERPELVTGLFYGVPGSGKSMLANFVGSELGRPVIKKTYAELQSMYVGEGEKNLSEAFAEAEMEGAILLIDELDSIAGNRKDADKNYQKTFVNQLLTELDSFKGIFLATSNFMDGLDPAVLRRLFLKVKFDFLDEEQLETAFKLYFPKLKRSKLGFLPYLTPGDFKAVKEAAQFDVQKLTIKRVRELLEQEIEIKKLTLQEALTAEKTVGYHI